MSLQERFARVIGVQSKSDLSPAIRQPLVDALLAEVSAWVKDEAQGWDLEEDGVVEANAIRELCWALRR